jgi:hypothetical protein
MHPLASKQNAIDKNALGTGSLPNALMLHHLQTLMKLHLTQVYLLAFRVAGQWIQK